MKEENKQLKIKCKAQTGLRMTVMRQCTVI